MSSLKSNLMLSLKSSENQFEVVQPLRATGLYKLEDIKMQVFNFISIEHQNSADNLLIEEYSYLFILLKMRELCRQQRKEWSCHEIWTIDNVFTLYISLGLSVIYLGLSL